MPLQARFMPYDRVEENWFMERNQYWVFIGAAFVVVFATAFILRDNPSVNNRIGSMAARFDALEVTGMLSGIDAHVGRIVGATRTKIINSEMTTKVEAALARIRSGSTESTPLFQNKKASEPKALSAAKLLAAQKAAAAKKKAKKKTKKIGEDKENKGTEETVETTDIEPQVAKQEQPPAPEVAVVPPVDPNQAAQEEAEEIPQSESQWAALVLREPDHSKTKKMVEYYQSRLIKANVFYAIVDKMLLDSRPKMQQLGVMALAATPSAPSFEALAEYASSEAADSTMKTKANEALAKYSTVVYVKVLAAVLTSTQSKVAAVEAHRRLRAAVELALKTPVTGGAPGANPTQASVAQIQYFRNFERIFATLETRYQDADLQSELEQTVNTFAQLLPPAEPNFPQEPSSPMTSTASIE